MYVPGTDHEAAEACAGCGICCMLYVPESELPELEGAYGGGIREGDTLEWVVDEWDDRFAGLEARGLLPLFDPHRALLGTPEECRAYRASLPPDTDFRRCQYCGDEGCVLPRDVRPPVCRGFACERVWAAFDARRAEPGELG